MNESWIKLFRKFREWGWYKDNNTKSLWLEILLTANYEDKEWRGIPIKRGQLITSIAHLSRNLNISTKSIRTSLNHLKTTNEVAIQTTSHYTLITVNKYNDYQEVANETTNKGQTSGKQVATTKEIKKERNKEIIHIDKKTYEGKTLEQVGEKTIEAFNYYLGTKYKDTKSFLAGLEKWLEVYSLSDIEEAIKSIKFDNFWNGKMSPVVLFRKKNPQGEPVDYIGQLLNSKKENYVRSRNN